MAFYEISQEEIALIQKYLDDGDRTVLETDAPAKLLNMSDALRRHLHKDAVALYKENARMKRKIAGYEKKADAALDAGQFDETGYDSVGVAKALLYCLQEHHAGITREKFMYVLFLAYASWLYGKRERFCIEHPVAQPYGPCFWRVAKAIPNTMVPRSYDEYKALAEHNPGLAAMIRSCATKYVTYNDSDLAAFIQKCPAYRNADRKFNNGKWNKQLSDAEIYFWKKDMADKAKANTKTD